MVAALSADVFDIYSRGQFKYGAKRNDFIHAWYERPLHQNTNYQKKDPKPTFLNVPAWRKTVETIRLGKMESAYFRRSRAIVVAANYA